jgi:hypothetical protein
MFLSGPVIAPPEGVSESGDCTLSEDGSSPTDLKKKTLGPPWSHEGSPMLCITP